MEDWFLRICVLYFAVTVGGAVLRAADRMWRGWRRRWSATRGPLTIPALSTRHRLMSVASRWIGEQLGRATWWLFGRRIMRELTRHDLAEIMTDPHGVPPAPPGCLWGEPLAEIAPAPLSPEWKCAWPVEGVCSCATRG